MAIEVFAPMPVQDPMVEPEFPALLDPKVANGLGRMLVTRVWVDWYTTINRRLDSAPSEATTPVSLVNQSASIGTTPIPIASVSQGMYRVAWYARVITAGSVSSSLQVSVGNTDQGVTCSQTSPAMTSNSANLPASGTFMVYADRNSIISYATTYASTGGTAMIYKLVITVEAVSAQ